MNSAAEEYRMEQQRQAWEVETGEMEDELWEDDLDDQDASHTEKVGNCVIRIFQDQDGESPREWDNLGTIAHWHSRYDLGEVKIGIEREWLLGLLDVEWEEDEDEIPDDVLWEMVYRDYVILPVALLDHSGLRIWVGSGPSPFDPGGWDSGQVGWVYCSREEAKAWFGRKRWSPKLQRKAEGVLRGEIMTFDRYLSGDVWGYVVEKDGTEIDSCWGFYGFDYCVEEAREVALRNLGANDEMRKRGKEEEHDY